MNKLAFVALMTSWMVTIGALAFALTTPQGNVREAERALHATRSPSGTWTCGHNQYRSVACP